MEAHANQCPPMQAHASQCPPMPAYANPHQPMLAINFNLESLNIISHSNKALETSPSGREVAIDWEVEGEK